jgi:Tol biopolymer transport system component
MTDKEWQKIQEIYHTACDKEPQHRAAFLVKACAGDPILEREVRSLLAASDDAEHFLSAEALESQLRAIPRPAPTEELGATLGHYEILSLRGRGGMAEVYLARDVRLGRRVALKLLSARLLSEPTHLRRFLREAQAASALNHPNIVTIYEIGTERGLHYIAMEYVEGPTLRERLRAPLEPAEAVQIALQALSGLEAAHRSGVVHRDVKPENIMIRADGVVKLVDFGIARIARVAGADADPVAHTETNTIIGTPRYMSPEQARGRPTDSRTDIFSFGVVLYEMLAARPPFGGVTSAEVFAALLEREPPPVRELPPAIAHTCDRLFARALAKSPEDRYRTVGEMAADLRRMEKQVAAMAPLATIEANRRPQSFRTRRRIGAIAAAALAVTMAVAYWLEPPRLNWFARDEALVSKPITSFPGTKEWVSFSPDGSQIAFAWSGPEGNGNHHIYVQVIGAGEPVQITHAPQDELFPQWSPDGKQIAFARSIGWKNYIYIVSALGGRERSLGEAGKGLAWFPNGKELVSAGPPGREGPGGLVRVSVDTGQRRRLTDARQPDSLPVVSPDGRMVAFTRSQTTSAREVFVIPADGGEARQLTFDKRITNGQAWTADSRELVFSSDRKGVGILWRIAARGGPPRLLSMVGDPGTYPVISLRGNQLAYIERSQDTNIWRYKGPGYRADGELAPFGSPEPFIASSQEDDSPAISPDGSKIAFVSTRTGSQEIWACDPDGSHAVQLTRFDGTSVGSPSWSPDSRTIAFDARVAGYPAIYLVGLDGAPPRQLTLDKSNNVVPNWSHDGRWVYYCSGRTGTYQIWKQPPEGGKAVQVTRGGAFDSLESPDGKLLYFRRGSGEAGVWSVPVDGGPESPVSEFSQASNWRAWGVTQQGFYFIVRQPGDRQTLRFYSSRTRRTVPVATLDKAPMWNSPVIGLSPDGRTLLYAQRDHSRNDIMLIDNFR